MVTVDLEGVAAFTRNVEWDLQSPHALSPTAYVAGLRAQLGLGDSEVVELVNSIEAQLKAHVEKCRMLLPVVKDALGTVVVRSKHRRKGSHPASPMGGENNLDLTEPLGPRAEQSTQALIKGAKLTEEELAVVTSLISEYQPYARRGEVTFKKSCHICHITKDLGGTCCPRGLEGHNYCVMHLKTKFNIERDDIAEDPETFTVCPICVLLCPCAMCQRKLDRAAEDFKSHGTVTLRAILKKKFGTGGSSPYSPPPKGGLSPASPMPNSMRGSKRKLMLKSSPTSAAAPSAKSKARAKPLGRPPRPRVEDGNVNMCIICNEEGEMLCCDKCPRAYHLACLTRQDQGVPDGDWQCPKCRASEDDRMPQINVRGNGPTHRCRAMLDWLRDHELAPPFLYPITSDDFGSQKDFKLYEATVSEKSDLGSVRKKLNKNLYSGPGVENFVRDVRLIWHNCKLFNLESSCLHRSADVLSRSFEAFYNELIAPRASPEMVKSLAEHKAKMDKLLLERLDSVGAGDDRAKDDSEYDSMEEEDDELSD
jgi:hypothetical protein